MGELFLFRQSSGIAEKWASTLRTIDTAIVTFQTSILRVLGTDVTPKVADFINLLTDMISN